MGRKLVPGATFFTLGNPAAEPATEPFDLIFVAGVFHHVQPPQRAEVMADIVRRARPGADIVIFEHNPYNPVTRKLVSNCIYDADAVLVPPPEMVRIAEAGKLTVLKRTYTLFFPAALKAIRGLENFLGWLPLGGQYFIHCKAR
ncbi:MAG: hypothetical protein FJX76_24545 [Armatimonadetes bacterium]|nr:hypothetical protein [Armatimonadota bacterium]